MSLLAISSTTSAGLVLIGAAVVAALLVCLLGVIFKAAVNARNVFVVGVYVLLTFALVLGYSYALFEVVT